MKRGEGKDKRGRRRMQRREEKEGKDKQRESKDVKWRKKLPKNLEGTYLDSNTIIGLFDHLVRKLFNLILNERVREVSPHQGLEPPDGVSEVHHHLVLGRQTHGPLLAIKPNNRSEQGRNSEACWVVTNREVGLIFPLESQDMT